MLRLAKIDELRTSLAALIGWEEMHKIYDEIKAEANTYGIDAEIARLESFVSLAATGMSFDDLFYLACNHAETYAMLAMGIG